MLSVFAASTASVVQYKLSECSTPMARSLITQATFCALERDAMLTSNQMVALTADMRAYLEDEASRRGVDVATVYAEEVEARAELARLTPRNADLLLMADRFPAPQAWYDE
jgi:hypothetical protein